ncbi:DUF2268 domain-containing protein [Bacillus sp. AK031]
MKRLLILVISSAICLLTAGCGSNELQADEVSDKPIAETENSETEVKSTSKEHTVQSSEVSVKDQTFNIISLNEEVLDYADTVLADSSLLKKEVYTEKVVLPFEKKLTELDAFVYYDYYSFLSPNTNIQKLKDSAEKLLEKDGQIQELIEEALADTVNHMEGMDKTIVVMPADPTDVFVVEKMKGTAGYALSENVVMLQIDPSFNEDMLKYSVAQTYHLTMQMENMAMTNENLLESFVLDGKADAFASIVYPDQQAPWTEPFSERLKNKVIEELKESKNLLDEQTYYQFTGYAKRGIPLWSNTKIGYEITQSYLENHPEAAIEEWTGMLPREIILGSDFKELYQELQEIQD